MSTRFDAQHERLFECTDCGETIIVGCHWQDLDPATYRGVVCGCRRPKPRAQAVELAATIQRARAAQAHEVQAMT